MVAYVWWFFTKEASEEDRTKLEARIWRPIPGSTKPIPEESPWSDTNEMKGFEALKAQTGA